MVCNHSDSDSESHNHQYIYMYYNIPGGSLAGCMVSFTDSWAIIMKWRRIIESSCRLNIWCRMSWNSKCTRSHY